MAVSVIPAGSERSDFLYTPDIEHLCNPSVAGKSSSGSKSFTCEEQRRKWVLVSPADFILADEDGAIVIPQAVVSETLGRAEQLTEQETKLRLELQNGLGLEQALAEFGHV
jgi:hypothetical protein